MVAAEPELPDGVTLSAAVLAAAATLSLTTGAFSLARSAACAAFSCTRGSSLTRVAAFLICS